MYRSRKDRARRVIALIIGCGIIVASWVIGCQQSAGPGVTEIGWLDQILRYVPGTKASSKPREKETVTTRAGKLDREIGDDDDFSKMILIPAGKFNMGTSDSIAQTIAKSYEVLFWEDEQPRHLIELDAYYIDKYEVSNSQYKQFLDITGYNKEPKYWRHAKFRQPHQPVIGVTWEDANRYARSTDKRLPTEAEWERAAAGSFGNLYPWGNEFVESNLNFDLRMGQTTSVAGFPLGVTASGIMNMAGNVAEWVADWYQADYYAKSPDINPLGPATGTDRVYRGGSWNDWQLKNLGVRCAKRYHAPPDTQWANLGFRCAKDVR